LDRPGRAACAHRRSPQPGALVEALTPRSASAARKAATVSGAAGIDPGSPCPRHQASKICASPRYAFAVAGDLSASWKVRTLAMAAAGKFLFGCDAGGQDDTGRDSMDYKLPRRRLSEVIAGEA
jgi:hypothetical protein